MISTEMSVKQRTTRDADESAQFLTEKIRNKLPFLFIRYGDGALECINGLGKLRTCDGELYTDKLGADLQWAWDLVIGQPRVYIGDWYSAEFGNDRSTVYAEQYERLIGGREAEVWLDFAALLLHRRSEALAYFYRAVRDDDRAKVLMGPAEMAPAARMLNATHVPTVMSPYLHEHTERMVGTLSNLDFSVLLYGAGMAGNVAAVRMWQKFRNRTYINIGSALDPLFRGRTRTQQLDKFTARELLKDIA